MSLKLLVGLMLLVGACASTHKDEGDYFHWTSSNEPDLVLDPNAPALPADEPVDLRVTSVPDALAERPVTTGLVQNETDVVVPIVKAPEDYQPSKPSQQMADVEPIAPQTATVPRADVSKTVPSNASDVSVLAEDNDASFLLKQSASTKRPRGVFVTVGSGPQKRYIKADQMYIRTRPDRYSKPLGLLFGGDEVHVTIRGDWAKLDEGRWIRSRWLVKTRPQRFKGGPPEIRQKDREPESAPEMNEMDDKTATVDSLEKTFVTR